jgi:hypothetical protein
MKLTTFALTVASLIFSLNLQAECDVKEGYKVYANRKNTHLTGIVKSITSDEEIEVSFDKRDGLVMPSSVTDIFSCKELWWQGRANIPYFQHNDMENKIQFIGETTQAYHSPNNDGSMIYEVEWQYFAEDDHQYPVKKLTYVLEGSFHKRLHGCPNAISLAVPMINTFENVYGQIQQDQIYKADYQIGHLVSGIQNKLDFIIKYIVSHEMTCSRKNKKKPYAVQAGKVRRLPCMTPLAIQTVPSIESFLRKCHDNYSKQFIDFNWPSLP